MTVTFPGFVDLQVNGFAGVDFNTAGCTREQLTHATEMMRTTGVTRFLPTLITSTLGRFAACAKPWLELGTPAMGGFHMEGPYISPVDGWRGAHPQRHVVAGSIDDFRRRQEAAGGRIVLVTLAPEVPGALRLIEHLAGEGVRVAIGHSAATAAQIDDAILAGATISTHLGNGCAPLLPRHENPLWPQLAADGLTASFIADGHHLPASVLKAMLRAKGLARAILVTDAISAATSPAGRYWLGDLEVALSPTGRVSQPGTENLAGSALTMDAAVGNTVRFCGLSLDEVLPLASTNPARLLGVTPLGMVTAEWDAVHSRLQIRRIATGINK